MVSGTALAQVDNVTVGPSPAPIGSPVSISLSVDHAGTGGVTGCPYRIYDEAMNLVFDPALATIPPCNAPAILLGPWGVHTAHWEQVDQGGTQVPAGNYVVEAYHDGNSSFYPLQIGGTEAALVLEGPATWHRSVTGESRRFSLAAPLDGGYAYFLLASWTTTAGIPTCAGPFPLDADPLFNLSAGFASPFTSATGIFEPSGHDLSPRLDLPEDPALLGLSFAAAFAVADFSQPCFLRRISDTHAMTIIG